jgi:hypothetical protein
VPVKDQNLHEREILVRDTFTPAEVSIYLLIIVTAAFVFLGANPENFWVLGFLLITAPLSISIIKLHQQTHPFFIDNLWSKYLRLSFPALYLILHYIVGIIFPNLGTLEINDTVYYQLTETKSWLPSSSANTVLKLVNFFGFIAAYLVAINILIVPKSLVFFERLIPKLCSCVAIVTLFGYIQKTLGLRQPLFTEGTGQADFFAFFPYDGHWAAFAAIWCGLFTTMALKESTDNPSNNFIETLAPYYLTGAVLLGFSGFIIEANVPAAILLISFSTCLLIFAMHFVKYNNDDNQRNIILVTTLSSCFVFAAGIFRLFSPNKDLENITLLRKSAWDLFRERPLFGWGFDSFKEIAPFFIDDRLVIIRHSRAASDALQYLAEFGLVGCLLILTLLVTIWFKVAWRKKISYFAKYLWLSCIPIVCLIFFDSPFMSPAVFFSFFLTFFIAVRWTTIENSKIDEVDVKRPQVIVPESERGVPYHIPDSKEEDRFL